MSERKKARVFAWCFTMQLRADPNYVSDCFRNILHSAQIAGNLPLDMVSFAWSPQLSPVTPVCPDANGPHVSISGFIRAHKHVRE